MFNLSTAVSRIQSLVARLFVKEVEKPSAPYSLSLAEETLMAYLPVAEEVIGVYAGTDFYVQYDTFQDGQPFDPAPYTQSGKQVVTIPLKAIGIEARKRSVNAPDSESDYFVSLVAESLFAGMVQVSQLKQSLEADPIVLRQELEAQVVALLEQEGLYRLKYPRGSVTVRYNHNLTLSDM